MIVDTGPLVALLNRRDRWHARALEFFRSFAGVAYTTWVVVTEGWHLLPTHRRRVLLEWLGQGGVHIRHVPQEDVIGLLGLVDRYRDRPMALADASLVWLAEREHLTDIVTLDNGFDTYRTPSGKRFVNYLG